MFEQQNQPKPNTAPPATGRPVSSLKTPQVEDIFSKTDQGQSKVVRPIQPGQAVKTPVSPLEENSELFGGRKLPTKKIILILLVIVLIVVVVGVVWGVYRFTQPDSTVNTNVNTPVNNQVNQNQAVDNTNQEVNAPADVVLPKDSDGDGLTDEEEKGLGTDINKADSDSDGLNDRAEVMLFKTNPLNSDTDGDGYLDGKEVINGYDPNKPGNARLYQTP